ASLCPAWIAIICGEPYSLLRDARMMFCNGRVSRGAIVEAYRATGTGIRPDHRNLAADRGAGGRLWRPAGSGGGSVMVARGRLSRLQRHPQQPSHEVRAGEGRFAAVGADQPSQWIDPRP